MFDDNDTPTTPEPVTPTPDDVPVAETPAETQEPQPTGGQRAQELTADEVASAFEQEEETPRIGRRRGKNTPAPQGEGATLRKQHSWYDPK